METSTAVPAVRTETKSTLAKVKTGLRKGTLWSLIWFRAACRWFFLDAWSDADYFKADFSVGHTRLPGLVLVAFSPIWLPIWCVANLSKLPSYLISKLVDR